MLMPNARPKITATVPHRKKRRAATFRFRMFIRCRVQWFLELQWLTAVNERTPLVNRSGERHGFFSAVRSIKGIPQARIRGLPRPLPHHEVMNAVGAGNLLGDADEHVLVQPGMRAIRRVEF